MNWLAMSTTVADIRTKLFGAFLGGTAEGGSGSFQQGAICWETRIVNGNRCILVSNNDQNFIYGLNFWRSSIRSSDESSPHPICEARHLTIAPLEMKDITMALHNFADGQVRITPSIPVQNKTQESTSEGWLSYAITNFPLGFVVTIFEGITVRVCKNSKGRYQLVFTRSTSTAPSLLRAEVTMQGPTGSVMSGYAEMVNETEYTLMLPPGVSYDPVITSATLDVFLDTPPQDKKDGRA